MEYHSLSVLLIIVCSDIDKTTVLVRCLSNDGFRAEAPVGYFLFYSSQVA